MSAGYEYIDEFMITIDVKSFRDPDGFIHRSSILKTLETALDTIIEEDGAETDVINRGAAIWHDRFPRVVKVGSWELEAHA